MIVATTRTGLNMSLSCCMNPIRNPVPIREMIMPIVYKTSKVNTVSFKYWNGRRLDYAPTKRYSWPKNKSEVPSIESTKPIARLPN